ncbi:putative flagella basal body P-ring formation protein FlgA [Burkholderia thailandensis]|nr:putative flagella basal body P-ring formation protein FlgA [Burkholderia thailandensis]
MKVQSACQIKCHIVFLAIHFAQFRPPAVTTRRASRCGACATGRPVSSPLVRYARFLSLVSVAAFSVRRVCVGRIHVGCIHVGCIHVRRVDIGRRAASRTSGAGPANRADPPHGTREARRTARRRHRGRGFAAQAAHARLRYAVRSQCRRTASARQTHPIGALPRIRPRDEAHGPGPGHGDDSRRRARPRCARDNRGGRPAHGPPHADLADRHRDPRGRGDRPDEPPLAACGASAVAPHPSGTRTDPSRPNRADRRSRRSG